MLNSSINFLTSCNKWLPLKHHNLCHNWHQLALPQLPQPVFVLSPVQLNVKQIIDYSTTNGKKLFKNAIKPLSFQFDVEPKNINLFCEKLQDHTVLAGWKAGNGYIMSIPDTNGDDHNLLMEYSQLTMANICTQVTGYIRANNCQAQNDF
jgi:hypothetical protein